MFLQIILWIVAVALIAAGLAGTVVPALPGLPLIFCGAWVAALIDSYEEIGVGVLIVLGVLTALGMLVDWISQAFGAKRAGATKLGILGSIIGTFAGVFTGFWGLLFMPLLGAAIGEFIDHQDVLRSGKVGFSTWVGMMVGTVVKLGIAFTMIGVVVAAWFI